MKEPAPSPKLLFDKIRPLLTDVCDLMHQSPLPANERAGLALMVAGHFVGNAHGEMKLAGLAFNKPGDVCDLIKDIIENPKNTH